MRLKVFLTILFVTLCIPLHAQQVSQPISAQKDAQALTIVNQALTAIGGISALSVIKDYKASGSLTFYQSPTNKVQGTVMLYGLGLGEFRMDSNLSTGVRSFSISEGRAHRKREDGTVSDFPPESPTPISGTFPYVTPIFPGGIGFPDQELLASAQGSYVSVAYKGLVQLSGSSAYDIQVQISLQGLSKTIAEYKVIDLFIDPSTFQLVMTQDKVPPHIVHQILYSNYKLINGILAPFSITEELGGQTTWDIQLNQVGFNSGLQDSNFKF